TDGVVRGATLLDHLLRLRPGDVVDDAPLRDLSARDGHRGIRRRAADDDLLAALLDAFDAAGEVHAAIALVAEHAADASRRPRARAAPAGDGGGDPFVVQRDRNGVDPLALDELAEDPADDRRLLGVHRGRRELPAG